METWIPGIELRLEYNECVGVYEKTGMLMSSYIRMRVSEEMEDITPSI